MGTFERSLRTQTDPVRRRATPDTQPPRAESKETQNRSGVKVSPQGSALEHEADRAAGHSTPVPANENLASFDTDTAAAAAAKGGSPLPAEMRNQFETTLGHDFSKVRVHADSEAASGARAVQARAYTLGQDIVFGAGEFSPSTQQGQNLLAHELMHVAQQSTGRAPRAIQRAPAAPGSAVFDRSKVVIGDIPDMRLTLNAGVWTTPAHTVSISFAEPTVEHLSWELYGPADNLVGGRSTMRTDPNPTTEPYKFDASSFFSPTEGRHILRCIGRNASHQPVVFADRSFYVWTTTTNASQLDLTAINAVKASPSTHSLGEIGAAHARGMMLEHQAAVAATGTGTVQGNQTSSPTAGVASADCTTYVVDVLKAAFAAKGLQADWTKVINAANTASPGGLKGTELLKSLVANAGWKGVFWSPDPRNPSDASSEHPVANKSVKDTGKYYGIDVDKTKSIVDYKPTSATKQETMTRLDELKAIPFGVIAARGGKHMTLILNGMVYEVHWDKPATDPNVIEATALERWQWLSGVIVTPP